MANSPSSASACPDGPANGVWPDSRDRSRGRRLFLVVGLVALLIRMIFFVQLLHVLPLYGQTYSGPDTHTYDVWAQEIAAGDWLSTARGPFYQAPLYPYLLAGVYALAGSGNVVAGIVMNGVFGIAAALLAAGLGRKLFGWRAGLAAGLLMALDGSQLSVEAMLLVDSLLPAFCLGALWLTVELLEREPTEAPAPLWTWLLPGLLLGLTAAGRGSNLLVAAALCAAVGLPFLWRRRWRRLGAAALIGVGVWVVVGVPLLRNGLMFDTWTITTNGPATLYISNAPDSTGMFGYPAGYQEVRQRAERSERPGMVWLRALVDEHRRRPGELRKVILRKVLLLFNAFDAPDNGSYYFARRHVSSLRLGTFGPLFLYVFGFCGIALTVRRWRLLVPLYVFGATYGFTLVLFHVAGRFKLPMLALLAVFGGGGLVVVVDSLRARRYGRPVACLALAAVLTIAFWPRVPVGTWAAHGELKLRTVEYVNHSVGLVQAGRTEDAIALLEDAFSLFPKDPRFAERLARLYLDDGRPAMALECLQSALEKGVVSKRILERRVLAYRQLSRPSEAREAARQLLQRYPDSQVGRDALNSNS